MALSEYIQCTLSVHVAKPIYCHTVMLGPLEPWSAPIGPVDNPATRTLDFISGYMLDTKC